MNIENISRFGFDPATGALPDWAADSDEKSVLRHAGNLISQIAGLRQRLTEEAGHISSNADLSDAGKRNRLGELGRNILIDLEKSKSEANSVRRALEEATAQGKIHHPVENDLLRELRASEIRHRLEGMDRLEIETWLHERANRGDAESVEALADVPGGFKLAGEDVIAECRETVAERVSPDATAYRRNLAQAVAELDGAIRDAFAEIVRVCQLEEGDPIRKIAREGLAAE